MANFLRQRRFLFQLIPILILLQGGHDATAEEASEDRFANLKVRFNEKKLEVDVATKVRLERLLNSYADAVEEVQKSLQSSGNLDGVIAAKEEIGAARSGSLLEVEDVEALPGKLREKRGMAQKAVENIRGERDAEISVLREKYAAALGELKSSYTKAGDLETAVAILEEMKRVSNDSAPPGPPKPKALEDLPESLRKGLIAWFPLDESDGIKVHDLGPLGIEGVLSGTQFIEAGRMGGARAFNGDGDRIALADRIPDSDRFTISVWVKYLGTPRKGGIFSDFTGANANDLMFAIVGMQGIHIRADKSGDKFQTIVELPEPLTTDWHHLVWVLGSRDSTIYVDGKEVGSYRGEGCNIGFHGGYIGFANDKGGWSYFHGLIDEFMMWDRTLDEEEVLQLAKLAGG